MKIDADLSPENIAQHAQPIPESRGQIYFLLDGDNIVYVGQTVSGIARIQTHAKYGKKHFDRYAMYECPEYMLNDVEAYFIVKFAPKYNMTIPPNNQFIPISTIRKWINDGWAVRKALRRLHIEPVWGQYYRQEDVNRILQFVKS